MVLQNIIRLTATSSRIRLSIMKCFLFHQSTLKLLTGKRFTEHALFIQI